MELFINIHFKINILVLVLQINIRQIKHVPLDVFKCYNRKYYKTNKYIIITNSFKRSTL